MSTELRSGGRRRQDSVLVDVDVDSQFGERNQIRTEESFKIGSRDFPRTISSDELVIEIQANLGDGVTSSEHETSEDVVYCVVAELAERYLCTCHDHCLGQVLEQER